MKLFKTKRTLKRDEALEFKTPTDIFGEYVYNRHSFDFDIHLKTLLDCHEENFEPYIERGTWSNSIQLLLLLKLSEGDFLGR